MQASEKCYQLLKHFEGCKLKAYKCSAGIPTIGYGSTFYEDGKPVKMGDTITKARAEALLPAIAVKFAQAVDNAVKTPVAQHHFDALVSLAYNIGIGNFGASTLLKNVNRGKPIAEVLAQFHVWNKARNPKTKELEVSPGLVRRRKSEAFLYETGIVNFFQ